IDRLPQQMLETLGSIAGVFACAAILFQIIRELRSQERSTLSLGYTISWWIVFLFWFFYGVRFRAVALWGSNAGGLILQSVLILVTLWKGRKSHD
ncbi:MAG: hypothetical protein RR133_01210, partial [Kiritimatiellia bacterium]